MNIDSYLAGVKGSKIVSLQTKTDVKLLAASKTKFPKGISKLATRNGIIGAKYENSVNNKLAANFEGDIQDLPHFEAESLWKGKGKNIDNYLVGHVDTGKRYLKFLPKLDADGFNRTESVYIDNATGQEISKEDFGEFLPKQSPAPFHGVKWQVVALENVISIR